MQLVDCRDVTDMSIIIANETAQNSQMWQLYKPFQTNNVASKCFDTW